MKKLLTMIIALVMMLMLASCSLLPEDLQATINGLKDSILGGEGGQDGEHTHEYAVIESKKAYCGKDGWQKLKCSCGDIKEEVIPALGHDVQYYSTTPATCIKVGSINNRCTRCSYSEDVEIPALGHVWGEFVEASRLITCTRSGCDGTLLSEGNGKYTAMLAFTFGDADKAALTAKHEELASILKNADKYDPSLHGYVESGDLADAYAVAEALYEEYSDMILDAQGQYSIAMTLYYCDDKNAELKQTYNDMMDYYTELVASFYSLSQPWYDSMFRDYFFYGATEEEINAFLFDSNAYANDEYTALKNRNDAIELEYNDIANPTIGTKTPELYYEFVQNGNRMADILGYENYLEYAYENVYDRDYTYEEVASFVDYVRQYIAPVFNQLYSDFNSISGYTQEDLDEYSSVLHSSFFYNAMGNRLFNDYIDEMGMAFTSNPDKQISFSDCLNDLVSDGNLFRGSYEGAYVTYVRGANIPIAYFGKGYDNSSTIAHEFGHYMNEIYNGDAYSQSFDLLETHSQGQEMLYISYVKDHLGETAWELVETEFLLNTLYTVMLAVQVDCFEQAVYLDYYDGPGSEAIMADNTITADEYDDLYKGLSEYLGIDEAYRQDDYWRKVVISSPCYYISYSISAINALQLYANANIDSFESAKQSYLKLFTYTDVDDEMILSEVLEYAGLLSYTNEMTYIKIATYINNR